jgi:hypothetical protein
MLKIIKNFTGLKSLIQNNNNIKTSIKLNYINKFSYSFRNETNKKYFSDINKKLYKEDKNIEKENIKIEENDKSNKKEYSIDDNKDLNFDVKLDAINSEKTETNKDQNEEKKEENKEENFHEKLRKIYFEFFDSKISFSEYKKIRLEYQEKLYSEFEVK